MPEEYINFITRINRKLGIDLAYYKEAQMKRRLTSLRNKRGYPNFSMYYQALEKNEHLLNEFVERLTINVSEFYRNPKRWNVLQNSIFPLLIKNKTSITIWSAACSTGEEPYGIAIMLKEYFPQISFRIVATDMDERVLRKARQGVYQEQALKELPAQLKKKYFTRENGLYYIDTFIKQQVSFRKHNLLSDRYPKNADLIVCRNVLIYFTNAAKELIYQNISNSLAVDGVLFVGSSEHILNPKQYRLALLETFFYQKERPV